MLLRIQDLTNEGLNLAGVQRVLALEAENLRLRAELARTREQGQAEVAEVERRNRYEIVPVRQAVVLFEGKRRRN